MRQRHGELTVATRGRGFTMITAETQAWVKESGIRDGLLTLLLQHTSASLLIQENADPDVRGDLERFFSRLIPEGDPLYEHTLEGEDDMPAHIRTALTATNLGLPVVGGRAALGTWQGIYLFEHRNHPHRRRLILHLVGE